jgi:hypothetical protein
VRTVGALVVASLAFGATAAAAPPAGHIFTVPEVKAQFHSHVGMRLVTFAAASTAQVTSLRTRPHSTERLGNFQLFVLHGPNFPRLRRVFTHSVAPDGRGVYWVPDRTGGWIAVTLYARNLVVAWFPTYPSRELDDRWTRLQQAVSLFARRR